MHGLSRRHVRVEHLAHLALKKWGITSGVQLILVVIHFWEMLAEILTDFIDIKVRLTKLVTRLVS